jgi:hypothetical protein
MMTLKPSGTFASGAAIAIRENVNTAVHTSMDNMYIFMMFLLDSIRMRYF